MGAYKVSGNSLLGLVGTDPLSMHSSGSDTGSIRVRHREYIGDLATTAAFASQTQIGYQLPLAVTCGTTFPWLSNMTSMFQCYKLMGMVFEFKSLSGTQSSVSSLGEVVFATYYDPTSTINSLFGTTYNQLTGVPTAGTIPSVQQCKRVFLDSQFVSSAPPSASFYHPIECDSKKLPFGNSVMYIPNSVANAPSISVNASGSTVAGAVPAALSDMKYCHGQTFIFFSGFPSVAAGTIFGEIWCSYDIVLSLPRTIGIGPLGSFLPTLVGPGGSGMPKHQPQHTHFRIPVTAAAAGLAYFGPTACDMADITKRTGYGSTATTGTYSPQSSIPINVTAAGIIQFHPTVRDGIYKVDMQWIAGGTATLTNAIALTYGASITAENWWGANAINIIQATAGETLANIQFASCMVRVLHDGLAIGSTTATIAVTAGTLPPAALAYADLVVTFMGEADQ